MSYGCDRHRYERSTLAWLAAPNGRLHDVLDLNNRALRAALFISAGEWRAVGLARRDANSWTRRAGARRLCAFIALHLENNGRYWTSVTFRHEPVTRTLSPRAGSVSRRRFFTTRSAVDRRLAWALRVRLCGSTSSFFPVHGQRLQRGRWSLADESGSSVSAFRRTPFSATGQDWGLPSTFGTPPVQRLQMLRSRALLCTDLSWFRVDHLVGFSGLFGNR